MSDDGKVLFWSQDADEWAVPVSKLVDLLCTMADQTEARAEDAQTFTRITALGGAQSLRAAAVAISELAAVNSLKRLPMGKKGSA